MYFKKTPRLFPFLFGNITWSVNDANNIYLTFDDGPDPNSTEQLLDLLDRHNIKSTFFCLGIHAKNHPELIELTRSKGHVVAHHGYEHLSGWKTNKEDYIQNLQKSYKYIDSKMYRPPYGQISLSQIRMLEKDLKLVMWTQMPGDFDSSISESQFLKNLVRHSSPGSIIALHDSAKAINKLKIMLPHFVEKMQSLGYGFAPLEYNLCKSKL